MKKGLALTFAVLMVMMVSAVVFAGPYFTLENDGMVLAPTFTGGCDYSFAVQTEPAARVFLDAHWDTPASNLTGSVGIGLYGLRAEWETMLDWNRSVNIFNGWNSSFTLTGNVFTGLKVWLGMSFNWDPTPASLAPPWTLVPVFGLEGRW